jgi:UDP-N-acetylmuramyl pentapeptide phosphotransferase/UDP-N-acetylglucosamine-1-phosphate transferase
LGAAVAMTLAALLALNAIAPYFEMLDQPDGARKRHRRPVPLTGGVALLLGAWMGALVATSVGQVDYEVLALLGIVATVHAFDDHSGLSPRQRLIIDAVVALAFVVVTGGLISSLGLFFGVSMELAWAAAPVTVFAYIALTNAYNMMDGIDGLAITQFLIAIVGVGLWHLTFVHQTGFDPLAFSLIAASLPVLLANLGLLGRPFKCFLGDSGSRFLGFFLVYVILFEDTNTLPPVLGAYFVALPLLDMCAVVAERFRDGRRIMQPDRAHLHYLLVDSGVSGFSAVAILSAISAGFVVLAYVLRLGGASDLVGTLIFLACAFLFLSGRRALVRAASGLLRQRMVGPAE